MTFIIGATGNVGSEVVKRFRESGHPFKGLSRKPPTSDAHWVVGDLANPASYAKALVGEDTLILISPAHPDMVAHQVDALQAAKAAGIKHIIKQSGLGAGPEAPIRLPKLHYEIEQAIVASGIKYTFVRPNLFSQVLLGAAKTINEQGTVYAPAGEGAISFTDVRDIADVIVAAATIPFPGSRTLEMTGPAALTYAEVATMLASVLKRDVKYVAVDEASARVAIRASGASEWLTEAFIELFGIYRAGYGAAVLPTAIEKVAGHPARDFKAFVRDYADVFSNRNAA
jgi:uncharacterized protein YbjT (DUF2867 family)